MKNVYEAITIQETFKKISKNISFYQQFGL